MHDQHLNKSPAIEVYGHCRLQLPWLRVPGWFFFAIRGWKIAGMGCWGLNRQPFRSLFSVSCLWPLSHGNPWAEKLLSWLRIEIITLDLSFQSGTFDHSAMATRSQLFLLFKILFKKSLLSFHNPSTLLWIIIILILQALKNSSLMKSSLYILDLFKCFKTARRSIK